MKIRKYVESALEKKRINKRRKNNIFQNQIKGKKLIKRKRNCILNEEN